LAKSLIISFQYNIESVHFFYSNPVCWHTESFTVNHYKFNQFITSKLWTVKVLGFHSENEGRMFCRNEACSLSFLNNTSTCAFLLLFAVSVYVTTNNFRNQASLDAVLFIGYKKLTKPRISSQKIIINSCIN
jgi:hypothetical protein